MKHTDSLSNNRNFKFVYKNGRSKANRLLVMYVCPNHSDRNRLGISVSKKVGNSVVTDPWKLPAAWRNVE